MQFFCHDFQDAHLLVGITRSLMNEIFIIRKQTGSILMYVFQKGVLQYRFIWFVLRDIPLCYKWIFIELNTWGTIIQTFIDWTTENNLIVIFKLIHRVRQKPSSITFNLGNISWFLKTVKHFLYQCDCYLLMVKKVFDSLIRDAVWRVITLKFQMGKWVL